MDWRAILVSGAAGGELGCNRVVTEQAFISKVHERHLASRSPSKLPPNRVAARLIRDDPEVAGILNLNGYQDNIIKQHDDGL